MNGAKKSREVKKFFENMQQKKKNHSQSKKHEIPKKHSDRYGQHARFMKINQMSKKQKSFIQKAFKAAFFKIQ